MESFKGRTAVVTCAASGIGLGVARALVAEGADVVMADVDEGRLADAVASLTGGSDSATTESSGQYWFVHSDSGTF